MNNDCVFCDRAQFEERLVFENKEFHVIATLGQITDSGYVLVAPKEHVLCAGAFMPEQTSSMLKLVKKVCRALSLEYQHTDFSTPYPITLFEHGVVGQTIQHAHLHLLPVVIDLTPKIRADFPQAEIEELKYAAHLQELYQKRQQSYLFWTVPSGKSMVCWNPPAPFQYPRTITAELLNRPERANWCKMDPELDKRLWSETVVRLKPYLFEWEPLYGQPNRPIDDEWDSPEFNRFFHLREVTYNKRELECRVLDAPNEKREKPVEKH